MLSHCDCEIRVTLHCPNEIETLSVSVNVSQNESVLPLSLNDCDFGLISIRCDCDYVNVLKQLIHFSSDCQNGFDCDSSVSHCDFSNVNVSSHCQICFCCVNFASRCDFGCENVNLIDFDCHCATLSRTWRMHVSRFWILNVSENLLERRSRF